MNLHSITKFSKTPKKISVCIAMCVVMCAAAGMPMFAQAAYQTEHVDTANALYKDFVVGPGKVELEVAPGESKTAGITVTNRMGETKTFSLEVEDFTGSRDPAQAVVLLGNERGPYSLKDFLKFETKTFDLKDGERAIIPVTVKLPTDAEPGGRYGSVLVSIVSKGGVTGQSSAIVSRLGVLFFVKTPGDVKQDASLKGIETVNAQHLFGGGPITFRLLFENNGSVYLNPYGDVKIKNSIGEDVGDLPADPWFSLPQSLRIRELTWDRPFLFGRYTAIASINRGYGNIVDTHEVSFWVIPWKIALGVFVAVFLLILAIRFVVTRFEFKRKV